MSTDIVICMDGTWNDPTERTNVYKLFQALDAGPENDVADHPTFGRHSYRTGDKLAAYYIEGVGAKGKGEGILGGTLGIGLHERVLHAFLLASNTYQKGDKLWIFGFSRGAWSARSLAGFISTAGLLSAQDVESADCLISANKLWLQTKTKGTLDCGKKFWDENDPIPIQLVGVWDTVGALGIPFFNGIRALDQIERHLFDFADLKLSSRVRHGRHALAIDEQRKDFEPTLWNQREDGSIKQVWFPGVHADIGGGYPEAGLSDITLKWMIEEIDALNSNLKINTNRIAPPPTPDETQDRHDESIKKIWSCRPVLPRSIDAGANIHNSVISRINKRSDYRPAALHKHIKVAAYFKEVNPPEKICATSEKLTTKQLAMNESVMLDIFAQNCWNAVNINVKQGERYEITASGEWTDKTYKVDADGYISPNELLEHFEDSRRVENKSWFCLIACVHPDAALEAHNPNAGNMITGLFQSLTHTVGKFDKESQLAGIGKAGTLDITKDGYMYLFANDAPWAYSNNSGYLTVKTKRIK